MEGSTNFPKLEKQSASMLVGRSVTITAKGGMIHVGPRVDALKASNRNYRKRTIRKPLKKP
jgi:hypothetical protein